MVRFNSDVMFIDTSGQVRAVHADLTLRANEAGGGHIIVGSGETLRPENNCDAIDSIDLGLAHLRWDTLYACSGNFLQRPTVNGSGVLLQGEAAGGFAGVDTINGVSGVVFLASVSDAITITENGQTIEFSGLFDNVSGILLDDIAGTLGSGVVNLLNGLSGVINLESPDGTIIITPSGNDIALSIDPAIVEGVLTLSGIAEIEIEECDPFQSTTSTSFIDACILDADIGTTSGLYKLTYSMQASCSQSNKLCQFRVVAQKGDVNELALMDVTTSFNVGGGDLPFAGTQFGNLPVPGASGLTITVDYRFADTGGAAAQLRLIALELERLGQPSGTS